MFDISMNGHDIMSAVEVLDLTGYQIGIVSQSKKEVRQIIAFFFNLDVNSSFLKSRMFLVYLV